MSAMEAEPSTADIEEPAAYEEWILTLQSDAQESKIDILYYTISPMSIIG